MVRTLRFAHRGRSVARRPGQARFASRAKKRPANAPAKEHWGIELNVTAGPVRISPGGLGGLRNPELSEPGPEGRAIARQRGGYGAQIGQYYDFANESVSLVPKNSPLRALLTPHHLPGGRDGLGSLTLASTTPRKG